MGTWKWKILFVLFVFTYNIYSSREYHCYIVICDFLIIAIYYGINGNRISWMNKNWSSIEVFDRVQKRWNVAGILGLIISIISLIIK